ncbi:hypothetical protein [Enterococcus phage MDA2]|uniref:Uncharacterized protein n=1 Tax=Enterococcus phage MDA2 TaxID=2816459 RepID=A0AAE7RFV5_9CAUD|nr:hypothetical protein [Enterococcus phage MDA2]
MCKKEVLIFLLGLTLSLLHLVYYTMCCYLSIEKMKLFLIFCSVLIHCPTELC